MDDPHEMAETFLADKYDQGEESNGPSPVPEEPEVLQWEAGVAGNEADSHGSIQGIISVTTHF